ncbi:MAG: ABC transporter permease [Candidatus Binatus sp.]|uniref:ABC transporter permease n=1 Tax=Candidatus Binatus sp. TaxID=2811406 RepID=UPI00271F1CA0|nr:ABC transporter permease [Candidatus Binatus sp.]MDO8433589.1 ABC transporter permease [Candidatus Binatus sp.]
MIPIKYNVRSLMVRRMTSAMTAIGVAMVVFILFILFGFVAGLRATVLRAGSRGNWIVLSRGTTAEPQSFVTREQYNVIRTRPEIAANANGAPLVSPEMVTAFNPLPDGALDQSNFTYLRGVYPTAFQVHRGIEIASGRMPEPGQAEMITGRRLAKKFPHLAPGHELHFGHRTWRIVGTFSDRGSARESEIWTDLDVLQQDVHFGNGFSSLHIVMKPGMDESLRAALLKDARLSLDAIPEDRFYEQQSRLADSFAGLGLIVAGILAIGAIFGGMNTMYTSVARRTREVGILRALGFSNSSILVSFIVESIVLALAGGVIGEVLGVLVATMTGLSSHLMSVEMLIFSFRMTPSAFISGLVAALIMGVLGGLLPAWRAAKITLLDSIRAA